MNGYFIGTAIILFGGVQGLFLVFALRRLKGHHRPANQILSLLILLVSLVLFSRLVYVEGVEIWMKYPHLFLLPDIPMFLYGPLIFLYVRSLFYQEKLPVRKVIAHFIPAILHFSILAYYLFETSEVYLRRLQLGNLIELPYAVFASIAHILFYLIYSIIIFRNKFQSQIKYSQLKSLRLYVTVFFTMVFICWLSWLYAALAEFTPFLSSKSFFSYHFSWIALSFCPFILAYFAISQPELFKNNQLKQKYIGSPLTPIELDILEKRLRKIMAEEKPHLNPKLSQQQLADLMEVPSKDLSRLMNERLGQNFFDFVNRHRIDEFKKLVRLPEKEHFTLLALALEVGFNSKTTFNAAFKKMTGMTPAQFKKSG